MAVESVTKMKEKVVTALKGGAVPALKLCEQLREAGEGDWLDQTYVENVRPELVGDDKDGLTKLIASDDWIKKEVAECRGEDVIHWMKVVKGLEKLPNSGRSIPEALEETA